MRDKEFLDMSEDLMGSIPDDKPTIEDILSKEENYKELLIVVQELQERY